MMRKHSNYNDTSVQLAFAAANQQRSSAVKKEPGHGGSMKHERSIGFMLIHAGYAESLGGSLPRLADTVSTDTSCFLSLCSLDSSCFDLLLLTLTCYARFKARDGMS